MNLRSLIFSLFILTQATSLAAQTNGGVIFECGSDKLNQLKDQLNAYQQDLGIDGSVYKVHQGEGRLRESLKDPSVYGTLYLRWDPQYGITEERISLPGKEALLEVETVSKKEILLALKFLLLKEIRRVVRQNKDGIVKIKRFFLCAVKF